MFVTLSLSAGGDKGAATNEEESVIFSDTTVPEMEVDRTVVETDITTTFETAEVENE